MAYSVHWYIENEIVYAEYSGETTRDDLRNSILQIHEMIRNSPRPLVHVITDVGNVTQPIPPKDALEINREIGAQDRGGWNLILREKSFLIKMGVTFATSVFKARTRTFDTMEEAEAFLKEQDSTISWDKADHSILAT